MAMTVSEIARTTDLILIRRSNTRVTSYLLTAHCQRSLTNVFVQKLQLVALLAEFDTQEIAHRKHPDPLLAIDDGQMAAANLFHAFQRLTGCFVTTNHRAQWARHLAQLHRRWIAAGHDDSIQEITLR